jgi:hypothetical protein
MTFQFNELKSGDRIKTRYSGMATVVETGCYGGKMVKLKCDHPKWCCPFFYEHELELTEIGGDK